jgi:tricorn protease
MDHFLYLYDVAAGTNRQIADSDQSNLDALTWSPDSHYLAFTQDAENTNTQIKLYTLAAGTTVDVTTDRYNSGSPAFSPDGKLLYFLSDRHLQSSVGSPWGPREPEPYFDRQNEIFFVRLQPGVRSSFQPDDELFTASKAPAAPTAPLPAIEPHDLSARLELAPIPPGNYQNLRVCGDRLYFESTPPDAEGATWLVSVAIRSHDIKLDKILTNAGSFEATPDGKKILTQVKSDLLVIDADGKAPDPAETKVNLDGWTFSFDPREEWRQMFDDAWRLHRDYLYASNMQGVDWPAMRRKYRPLVERVADRTELSDVLAQMMGEISLLHTFVTPGDRRTGMDDVALSSLGAVWERAPSAGGYRITRLYRADPDRPELRGPLLHPGVDLSEGDVIAEIDGVPTLSVPDAAALLRAKVGKQMRIRVYTSGEKAKSREAIVVPISTGAAADLRYADWEYSRRLVVEKSGGGQIGYVHLRATGSEDIDQWAREFYPVFDRQGLIVDVRHNGGGNIDSWILEKLMRKAWMYWNQHRGKESWNMQYAFRGQIVVLCDENTASDGEAFTEGFRRLGLGKIIGTRTWGGEVWLSGGNTLVDRGVATAAESGVYGPEGKWLIEGHGVDPDITVDNLPHRTFLGDDAQLAAGVKFLQAEIAKHPNPPVPHPPFPDKSFKPKVSSSRSWRGRAEQGISAR